MTDPIGEPPGPTGLRSLDELATRLGRLRAWCGLGYREVHRRVVELRRARGIPEQLSFNTVYRCMQPGRSRLDVELVVDIARVLLGDEAAAVAWRVAYQVLSSHAGEAAIVQVSTALPDYLPGFVGRQGELQRLIDELTLRPDVAPVAVIEGMAGVGKTTLAVHASRQLLRRGLGTDVQLWVNLRGYDRRLPPADPAAVLEGFLRMLGVVGDEIYRLDLAGRVARYRRLLGGRRALIVLDNAANPEQVAPLLPQTTGCLTLVTSRHALGDLPTTGRFPLGTFSEAEALEVLRQTLGPDRVDATPQVALHIAGLVGFLPLALAVVAGRINSSPDWTLADHLARLAERHQLHQLDNGIEVAFDLSYHALAPGSKQMLRLLALHCGRDFDNYAAAALAGLDLPTTNQRLDNLVAANLLQRLTSTRYQFHDLIHIYAAARAIDDEPAGARQTALTRLFDNYLYTASQAMDTLYPAKRHRRPTIATPISPVPPIADRVAAKAWLVTEHANLLATVTHTANHGWPAHSTLFSATLARWIYVSGHHTDGLAFFRNALAAARTTNDQAAEGVALLNLGWTQQLLGQYPDAISTLDQAWRMSRQAGDRLTEAHCHDGLGAANETLGGPVDALEHFLTAATMYRQLGDQTAESVALNNIADAHERLGRYDQAILYYHQALAISREAADHIFTCHVLGGLSSAYVKARRLPEARHQYEQALAIHHEHGGQINEALILSLYGLIYGADHPDTDKHHRRSVAVARETGARNHQPIVFNNIGEALRIIGRYDEALEHYQPALEVARELGERLEQARAHDGIAHIMRATDQPDQARTHWEQALAIYTTLGSPLATQIQAHLEQRDLGVSRAQPFRSV